MDGLAAMARAFAAMAREVNVPAVRAIVEVARRERNMSVRRQFVVSTGWRGKLVLLWDIFRSEYKD